MKKILLFIISINLVANNLFSKKIDTETLFQLERLSDISLSPDGKFSILKISKAEIEKNNFNSQIYLIDNLDKSIIQLTNTGNYHSNANWSPSGKEIYFLSNRNGSIQAYRININGGEAEQVTSFKDGISNLKISPNGKYISFTREIKIGKNVNDYYPELKKLNAKLYDNLPIRHWDHYIDKKYKHIFVMSLDYKDTTDLMNNQPYDSPLAPFGGNEEYSWSLDSKEIAYTCKKVNDYETSTNSDIYIVSIEGGKSKNITLGMNGYDKVPIYSFDGKYIAFLSMERAGYESDRNRIMLYNRSTKDIKELTKGFDQPATKIRWSDDNNGIYFLAPNGEGTNQIHYIDLNGKIDIITSGEFDNGLRGLDFKQNTLIYTKENFNTPPNIFIRNLNNGKEEQLSHLNKELMKDIDKIKIEKKWVSAKDGKKIHTWIIYPPNFDKNKKYPMLTYCQGGPQQQISQYFSYGWSFLNFASNGYIVVAPNRRGCPGFGQDWTDAINQDYGGMPYEDIMSAAREVAKETYVDKNRIAAIGASAGGYMTFYMAGVHNGFFSSFVSHCGIFNAESMYGSTEELFFPNWDNGGPYWNIENKDFYEKFSPHKFAQNWDTPILIITGELDYRVPYTQSLEAFTLAQSLNIPSKIIVYPEENHWVLKPQNKIFWYKEFFKFLDENMPSY